MGQPLGRTVEGDAALVQHENGIVELQMGERMGDGEDNPAVLAGKIIKQAHDLALGAGVKAGGDLVAEQDLRIGHKFHREAEAALLAAREDFDGAIAYRTQAGFLKDPVDTVVELGDVFSFYAQAGGGFHRFVDSERIVGDGKLGDVAHF